MKGAFIVLEGIDGSGKTTLATEISDVLRPEGRDIVVTQEPTYDEIGSFIRAGKVEGISQEAEALLFVADRAVHTARISHMVDVGKVVICDRYFASTVAYQSAPLKGVALDRDWLLEINKPVIRIPDITFLLDIDVGASLRRVVTRGERSKFEDREYLEYVRSDYLKLANEFDFKVVDAERDREEVLDEVIGEIRKVI
jgi:dTMP kinase